MIVNRLSRLMGERRVGVREVARETKLATKTVVDIYYDRTTRFDRHTIDALCTYFGVDTQQLLEWRPDGAGA